jgi:flagellin
MNMSVINTNILSINAQRNLGKSQGSLAQSLQRLSSGLRINSAKDDASGLAISERFTSQIRGQQQAVRNANDGISLAQIGEGALGTASENLQRIRELAVQAANDTNSASDREALNSEAQQLIAEIGRIADSTEFAGRFLLNGSVTDQFFQVGANQGQSLVVQGVDARATELGRAVAEGNSTLTQIDLNNGITSIGDVTISVGGTAIVVSLAGTGINTLEGAVQRINERLESESAASAEVRSAVLSAAIVTNDAGDVTISIRGNFGTEFSVDGGNVTLVSGGPKQLFGAVDAADQNTTEIDIATRSGAIKAIAIVEGALDQISRLRADFGAVQSRFESTISNLNIAVENTSAARSRVQDADFAIETANLTRAQILQQAGTSVLAQANAVPQSVLSLLN